MIHATDRCFEYPDHRKLGSTKPAAMILTTEWSCEAGKPPSVASIKITAKPFVNQRGERISNLLFDVELVSVEMNGRKAPEAAIAKIRQALEPFNTISIFQGRCFQTTPGLFISGFELEGERQKARRSEIVLAERYRR